MGTWYDDPSSQLSYKMWDQEQSQQMPYDVNASKQNMTGDIVQGAAMGSMAGPQGAAIGAGGAFLNSYLQAKAAEEQQRKQLLAQAAQTQGQGEQNALSNLMSAWGRVLT